MLRAPTDLQEILSFLEAHQCLAGPCGANVLLQCGYFDTSHPTAATDPADDFALLTCRLGLALARQLKQHWPGTRVQFGTLVNDLGQSCGADDAAACPVSTPDQAVMATPATRARISEMLRAAQVPADHHAFFFERNLRNRGLRMIKSGLSHGHPRLIHVDDGDSQSRIFLQAQGMQRILVATRRGQALTGKCPVIMGAFYRDAVSLLRHRFHQDSRPSLVIDLCHLADRDKVLRGIEVARALGTAADAAAHPPAHLVPVFLDSAGGSLFSHCAPFQE